MKKNKYFAIKRFVFITCLFSNCASLNIKYLTQQEKVELYITPRTPKYGWYDNGVFQFELNKKSKKVGYAHRTYNMLMVRDSVYELFYTKTTTPKSLFDNLTLINDYTLLNKRILIIARSKDTMYIDANYNLIKGKLVYKISNEIKTFVESYMPDEIKENWVIGFK